MSVINTQPLIGASGNQVTGYNLTKSLRIRGSASGYLSRTPASAGNRQKFTWAGWVKRGSLGTGQSLFASGPWTYNNQLSIIVFRTNDTLDFESGIYGISTNSATITTQVFRDTSAWYHIVVAVDTTQATDTNRVKMYVNGVQVTSFTAGSYGLWPTQNYDTAINTTQSHRIGNSPGGDQFDGYIAEQYFIDGQQLTSSSFGEFDTITGVWKPKQYTGTYGTNGFYLPFTDAATTSGSNAGLGKDFSGNGNYFNTNNISVTSGSTYDSMTDVPTLTSATTANYAVWNPLTQANANYSFTNGNLNSTNPSTSGANFAVVATMAMPSTGQFYWELTATAIGGNSGNSVGIVPLANYSGYNSIQGLSGYAYGSTGNKLSNGSSVSYGASWTTNDVIGVAYDAGAGSLTFYKNGTSQGVAFTGLSGQYVPAMDAFSAGGMAVNFGQRPFAYTPPTGYVALNTYNLPTSTIVAGNKYMDATTYTANGGTQTVTNSGFKPDFVWNKTRGISGSHNLVDSVRGISKYLFSNSTAAEGTDANYLTALNSDGFSLGSTNFSNGTTMVAWQWQAGQGTTSSNSNGSITSTVSVNASAGFSVVTWTGNGSGGATIGHGLGVAPSFIVSKRRDAADDWSCYHVSLGGTKYIDLNSTAVAGTSIVVWNNTNPSSSVVTLGTSNRVNGSGATYVAYCWAEIAGFSKFGSYTGNGSTDGTFVYTGFRPKFILIKRTDTTGSWILYDTARMTYNTYSAYLYPNLSNAEDSSGGRNIDVLSNGFKCRDTTYDPNVSGGTYIYAAFAENPFKNSLAR